MPENEDKSIDDQIKEAELAKLKAEAKEIERRGRQVRILGVPLVQVIFGGIVVGFVLLNYIRPIIDLNTEINSKEKELNEITDRLERTKIEEQNKKLEEQSKALSIAQENIALRATVLNAWAVLNEKELDSALKSFQMIKANNFFDSRLNPTGTGIENEFYLQRDDGIVFDAATGLTWQRSGSEMYFEYEDAQGYIQTLNSQSFGGYADWRLPTLREAMTLMEPESNDHA